MKNTTPIKEQFKKFMEAVKKGNIAEMETSFNDIFINKKVDKVGRCPLHISVLYQKMDATGWLLDRGANVNSKSEGGLLPIHFGAQKGNIDILKELVAHGSNVNSKGENGCMPMHYAAMCGKSSVIKLLMENGADINCVNNDERTPLHIAAEWGQTNTVQWLLDAGADANVQDKWHDRPIDWAILRGQTETVDILRLMQPLINTRVTPFVAVACAGSIKQMRQLLDEVYGRTVDMNEPVTESGTTVMHWVAINGHIEMMNLLMEHGANVEAEDKTKWRPLHFACYWDKIEMVRWLVKTVGCVLGVKNTRGQTPLDIASQLNRTICVRIIEDEWVRRRNEEFQIFHLSTVSVICRKYKIYDWNQTFDSIKSNIPPIARPVVICHFNNPLGAVPSTLVHYELTSVRFYYREYLVADVKRSRTKLKEITERIRDWDIDTSVKSMEIQLNVRKLPDSSIWNTCISIGMDMAGHPSVSMLIMNSIKGVVLKSSFVDFMKFENCWKMHVAINTKPVDNDRIIHSLQNMMIMHTQIVMFYDKNQEKLSNSKSINECSISNDNRISVVPWKRRNVQLIPLLHHMEWTKEVVSKFVYQEYLLILSITDDGLDWAMPWLDATNAANVKAKIRNCINELHETTNNDRMFLIGSDGEIADDDEIIDDVIHYTFVSPYSENVKKIENIGKGSYGLVYSCQIKSNEKVMAIKEIDIIKGSTERSENNFMNEIIISARVGCHERIIKYHKFFENDHSFFIVMDCMKGTLSRYLKEHYPLDEEKIISYARQIVEGLKHLHDRKIIHRDMKFQNVLLDENDSVKLSDFGLSKYVDAASSELNTDGAATQVGTERYIAPEVLNSRMSATNAPEEQKRPKYGQRADIWSFGAMMVEMLTGKPPYPNLTDAAASRKIRKLKTIEYDCPLRYSTELKDMVQSCLNADPLKRPSCAALLMNPFFKNAP